MHAGLDKVSFLAHGLGVAILGCDFDSLGGLFLVGWYWCWMHDYGAWGVGWFHK